MPRTSDELFATGHASPQRRVVVGTVLAHVHERLGRTAQRARLVRPRSSRDVELRRLGRAERGPIRPVTASTAATSASAATAAMALDRLLVCSVFIVPPFSCISSTLGGDGALVVHAGDTRSVNLVTRKKPSATRPRVSALFSPPGRTLIEYVQDRPGHDRRYSLASDSLRDELAGRRKLASRKGSPARSTGTATTRTGGRRSARVSTGSTTSVTTGGRCRRGAGAAAPAARRRLGTTARGQRTRPQGGSTRCVPYGEAVSSHGRTTRKSQPVLGWRARGCG